MLRHGLPLTTSHSVPPSLGEFVDLSIYCADVGSESRGRFGWASARASRVVRAGDKLEGLSQAVASDLNRGIPVALGFECPLFIPITPHAADLTRARIGEGSRAWCAGAGAGALATGLGQVVWVLQRVAELVKAPRFATLDWREFTHEKRGLFLWEAFVTGVAKGNLHVDDAGIGALAFERVLPDPMGASAIQSDEVHSLAGAALLRSGWSDQLDLLATPCTVIRA